MIFSQWFFSQMRFLVSLLVYRLSLGFSKKSFFDFIETHAIGPLDQSDHEIFVTNLKLSFLIGREDQFIFRDEMKKSFFFEKPETVAKEDHGWDMTEIHRRWNIERT